MASEPTSALNFGDMILAVAEEMGVAFYGENGDEIAQIPVDAHDLDKCKRVVNSGIRMFFNDAPLNGWRFTRPVAEVDIWSPRNLATATTCTAVTDSNRTLVTSTVAVFKGSMELKLVVITDVGTVMITNFISATQVEVDLNGNAVWTAKTFSIASDGNFTMPKNFAGMQDGEITYVADTNQGIPIRWANEAMIRQVRENVTDETGDPYWAAIRIVDRDGLGRDIRRRYEFITYPKPDEDMTFEFPFELYFERLNDENESPPTPFIHDETLLSACLAVVERDVYDAFGRHWQNYHQKTLMNSFKLDGRSGPRRLGYFGNPSRGPIRSISEFRRTFYDRPEVQIN